MKVKVSLTTELFDRDGKLLWRRKRRSKSFVKAFLAILLQQMSSGILMVTTEDVTGTTYTIIIHAINFFCRLGAADSSYGLVVGSGTTPVTATDFKLATQIVHGAANGQLSHSAVLASALTIAHPNVSFTIWRDFTNNTLATITVKEEGLYCRGQEGGGTAKTFCAIRDVESSPISVPAGYNLRMTYTIQTST